MLTSVALYVWADLVTKVLCAQTERAQPYPLVLPLEAVDMSLYDEHVLLVMATNAVSTLMLTALDKQPFDQFTDGGMPRPSLAMSENIELEDFVPDWEHHDVRQSVLAGYD